MLHLPSLIRNTEQLEPSLDASREYVTGVATGVLSTLFALGLLLGAWTLLR